MQLNLFGTEKSELKFIRNNTQKINIVKLNLYKIDTSNL